MSGWDSEPQKGKVDWNSGAEATGFTDNWTIGAATSANGFSDTNNGFNSRDQGGNDGFGTGEAVAGGGGDNACRRCGVEGHFARDCPEPPKMGACFNCGEDGHSKIDCPNPRVFKGACRTCGEEGHPAADCPKRVVVCRQCMEEGHETIDCKNPKKIDRTKVADKTQDEAWDMLAKASNERDITDFKDAVQILSKAIPEMTYDQLEKACRKRDFKIYLIALHKDHGDTLTNVNLQGETEKKFTVGYFLSDKPQRPSMKERWPQDVEDNFKRLADAGLPMDRGIDKCHNCDQLGHTTRNCKEEKRMLEGRAVVSCALCGEEGHRVRDCTQERKPPGGPKACKVCESEDHLAKDCPSREKRTCRNCGSEDHMAKECDQPRNPDTIQCRNCDAMGHTSRDCTAPKDWSRITCKRCGEKGHGEKRCKMPAPAVDNPGGFGDENTGFADNGGHAAAGWGPTPVVPLGNNDWENGDSAPVATLTGGGW